MNQESASIDLRKFRDQNNVITGKGPLIATSIIKLVWRFEKTETFEARERFGQQCIRKSSLPCITAEMETLAPDVAPGISSACEGARCLGLRLS